MSNRLVRLIPVAALAAAGVGVASTQPTDCAGSHAGGEWRSYSHDLSNSRHQPLEDTITPATVEGLEPAWILSLDAVGADGAFGDITPVVADGCIYLNTGAGLLALNADSGEVVWHTPLARSGGTPTVTDGKVFVDIPPTSTAAFDQETGTQLWLTDWADPQPGSGNGAGAVVVNGIVFSGVQVGGAELDDTARNLVRGQYGLLDADTGEVLAKDWVIPDADYLAGGNTGGGLWATAAADPETGYIYAATGNPFRKEHPNTNAILKIDADPSRDSFGEIVDAFHGRVDTYIGDGSKPACEAMPLTATCEFDDLDFGSSPQLFDDGNGRKLVGDLQKSGEYHAADADTMDGVWTTIVGSPAQPGGVFMGAAATSSFDGERIVALSAYPGVMQGLDATDGAFEWAHPVASHVPYHAVTTAGGLAYTIDMAGILWAIDTETGEAALTRQMTLDIGAPVVGGLTAAGVAVARNTVFAPIGSYMVAYRLPA